MSVIISLHGSIHEKLKNLELDIHCKASRSLTEFVTFKIGYGLVLWICLLCTTTDMDGIISSETLLEGLFTRIILLDVLHTEQGETKLELC